MDLTEIVERENVNKVDNKGMNLLHHAAVNKNGIEVF
jgi:hypothetical protein